MRDKKAGEQHRDEARCREGEVDVFVESNGKPFGDALEEEWMRDPERLRIDHKTHAAREKHARQRDEKRRELKNLNQKAHQCSKSCADNHSHQDGKQPAHAMPDQRSYENARKSHDCADRQINPAGENDKSCPDGSNAEERVITDQIHENR